MKHVALVFAVGTLLSLFAIPVEAQRQMERLDRGVVAVHREDGKVYVGWRMFGTDRDDIAFNLYRSTDGKEAIEKALRHQPDAIVMDVEMPVMDGYESTLRLGENPETCHIPVIMLTVSTDIDSVNRGFDCGCVDYLPKPVKMGSLMDSLTRALKQKTTRPNQALQAQAL